MFNFIDFEYDNANVTDEYIIQLEKELGISFPTILKKYYLQHNGAEIKECSFEKEGIEYCVVLITSLNFGTMPLEKIIKYNQKNEAIPKSFVPLAVDEDEDDYYWDAKDGKVYYLSLSNVEHPREICGSVEEFFELLNACDN